MNKYAASKGVVALSTTLLISGIIIEIAISGLLVSYFLVQGSFGAKWSADALAVAQTGIQDGLIKIVRDKDLNYITSGSPYSISVGDWTAQVEIRKDTPGNGKSEIISSGSAKNKQRRLQAILDVDSQTGKVKVESIKEIVI